MPIARLYETEQQAQDAAAKLSQEFSTAAVYLITPSSDSDAARTLKGGGFDAADAQAYAVAVAQGRSLVASNPPFGNALPAKTILDEFGPLPAPPMPSTSRQSDARYTPFSDLLGWSLLTRNTQQAWWWGTELKRYDVASFGVPLLQRKYNWSFGIPRLLRSYNLSFGIPRLNRAYNLSFGIPRLNRAYNLSFGIPRLLRSYNLSGGIPRLKRDYD